MRRRKEITITVKGRKTGKDITLPVWFVHEGSVLMLLPVRGSSTQWFRNLQSAPEITVQAGNSRLTTDARVVRDRKRTQDAVERFRRKYGADQIAKYYTIFDGFVEVPLS
ncbi:MAG: nitroreductase family deazaflavin-dependent oxidoreductase [Chloroflexi bacterium]|nr:nitroreductase family deazaflavin-dependent oxidoreductase [Chloroflexota bacterium]